MYGLIASFASSPISKAGIRKALDRMHRRGPDGEGFWKEEGVFLGPRRSLSLILTIMQHNLCNQLLRDSDWASMDHSVELRTPLVDAHLLESIKSALPSFERHPKKKLLAKAPANPLPSSIIERRKTGFAIPVDQWLSKVLSRKNEYEHGLMPWARKVASLYGDNCH